MDASSITDKFDSMDHGDKTLQQVHGLFDDKQSNATPAMSSLNRHESGVSSEIRLEEEDLDGKDSQIGDHLNEKPSS